jgi:hypothetical protein
MPRHLLRFGREREAALDIVSYGRRGPGHPQRFTPEQVAQVVRTVRRAPEVMVKVSGGAKTTGAAAAHFRYITRRGELEIETDDGERMAGKDVAAGLVEDWDLDLDAGLDRWDRMTRGGRTSKPKLAHNIVLSMPAGTPAKKLLAASREFAREEFAAQHRYAFVLHTDQDHPHVHLVVSAHRREGGRLNIRKADLRRWREQFALELRRQGIQANATPAQVRGRLSDYQKDGIFRATRRGASHVAWERAQRAVAAGTGVAKNRPPSPRLFDTAEAVQGCWWKTRETLLRQGMRDLAMDVENFRQRLAVPRTRLEREVAALRLRSLQMERTQ